MKSQRNLPEKFKNALIHYDQIVVTIERKLFKTNMRLEEDFCFLCYNDIIQKQSSKVCGYFTSKSKKHKMRNLKRHQNRQKNIYNCEKQTKQVILRFD